MSTEYRFVKEQRRKEAEQLSTILQIINDNCKNALAEARETMLEMTEDIDSIEFELDAAIQRCAPDNYDENKIIGISTAKQFSWRTDNGFYSVNDVEKFLTKHPGWHIEDEYGTPHPAERISKSHPKMIACYFYPSTEQRKYPGKR